MPKSKQVKLEGEYFPLYFFEEEFKRTEIDLKNKKLEYKNCQVILKEFYDSIIDFCKQYDTEERKHTYAPSDISEIRIEKTREYYVYRKEDKLVIEENKEETKRKTKTYYGGNHHITVMEEAKQSGTECIVLNYGVSGGLHFDVYLILLQRGTRIDYLP